MIRYDETVRRAKRTRHTGIAYMHRGRHGRAGPRRIAIEMGERAVDRVVGDRYDWRDTGLGSAPGRRSDGGKRARETGEGSGDEQRAEKRRRGDSGAREEGIT